MSLDVALPFGADVEDVVQSCRRDTPPCARLSCKGPAAIRCEPHALIDAQTAVCFARSEGMRGLDRPRAESTYDTHLRRIVWQVRVTIRDRSAPGVLDVQWETLSIDAVTGRVLDRDSAGLISGGLELQCDEDLKNNPSTVPWVRGPEHQECAGRAAAR